MTIGVGGIFLVGLAVVLTLVCVKLKQHSRKINDLEGKKRAKSE